MNTIQQNRNRYLFLLVSFIFWFSHFIYVPMLSPYLESMNSPYTFIGIVLGSYGLMQFLFRLPFGIFSDLVKIRKPFIVFGMAVSLLSCLAFAVTDSLGWVLVSRSLAGVAAATWVAFTILFSSYFSDRELHRAMGSISFAVVLAQLLGMAVSGYVIEEWGWHAPFWIGGAIGFIGLFLSLFIFEPKQGVQKAPVQLKELLSVMKEPMLLKVSFLSILAHSIIFTTMFGFTTAYALKQGLQAGDISLLVFSFMIPHAAATLFSGKWLVPFFGQWKLLQMAFGITAVFTFCTPFAETKAMLCLLQGINGFALGLLFPVFLGMAVEKITHAKRATAMGAYQALYAVGMFAGPFIAGILNTQMGIEAGFFFTGLLGAVAFICAAVWGRKETRMASQAKRKNA